MPMTHTTISLTAVPPGVAAAGVEGHAQAQAPAGPDSARAHAPGVGAGETGSRLPGLIEASNPGREMPNLHMQEAGLHHRRVPDEMCSVFK
jgi:hypothetical protein